MNNSKSPFLTAATLGALIGALPAAPAGAASLATSQVSCQNLGTVAFGPGSQSYSCDKSTVNNSGIFNYSSSAHAATSIDGLWALAQGSVTGGEDNSFSPRYVIGNSTASLTYDINVVAPSGYDPGLLVPLDVSMYLATSVSGGDFENQSTADASVDLLDNSTAQHNFTGACVHGGYPGDCSQSTLGGSITDNVSPNALVTVKLQATINLRNGQGGIAPAQAYAYADPQIVIDPAFLAAHPGYSLVFGANVTNPPPVPVPAAGWLLGSGLLGLAGAARRRRTL